MLLDRKTFEAFGALELGIVIPSCSVKESLKQMTAEDSIKAKRKWRKLCKKASKDMYNDSVKYKNAKKSIKRQVRKNLVEDGKNILSPDNSQANKKRK